MSAACAPNVFRVDAGAMFVEGRGEIALQNAGGTLTLHDEQNSLENDFNVGERETSPYLRATWERGLHRIYAHGFGYEAEGSGTLAGDFGSIAAGTSVNTTMDFLSAGAAYTYEVWGSEHFHLGLGGQLGYSLLNVDTRAQVGVARDEVETDVLVPMPFAEFEANIGDVSLAASAGVMAADLGDANGRYVDIEALARWQMTDSLQVMGGYRYLVLDAFGAASGRDFDADVDFHGFFVAGGISF